MNQPIPIKDVLADADHPMHIEMKDMMGKIDRGGINMCACMGPMYGEPHCYCKMISLGIPLSVERVTALAEAQKSLDALFGPGGIYHKPTTKDAHE